MWFHSVLDQKLFNSHFLPATMSHSATLLPAIVCQPSVRGPVCATRLSEYQCREKYSCDVGKDCSAGEASGLRRVIVL